MQTAAAPVHFRRSDRNLGPIIQRECAENALPIFRVEPFGAQIISRVL